MNKWDGRFIKMAILVSSWSKDPSTKCGAIIVDKNKRIVSVGFNGFPKGTSDHPDFYADRPEKIRRVMHAEKNAILFAKQDLTGCILYVSPMPPCSQCAGMIIQSGIKRVVTFHPNKKQQENWGDDINTTTKMFKEAEISMEYLI